MFTGIIEDLGTIANIKHADQGAVLAIRTRLPLARIALGESIAVNGCCLTVTRKGSGTFSADVSAESLRRTVLGELKAGNRVNLERCLTLDKLLGGHLVSGHVDGVCRIAAIAPEGDSRLYTFEVSAPLAHYLIEKGSVAIDGISLTVFDIRDLAGGRTKRNGHAAAARGATFKVALIPHTLAVTTLGFKQAGDRVNVESDMLVKYVERVASPYLTGGAGRSAKSRARTQTASVVRSMRDAAGGAS